jgi:hypothetical protein
MQLSIRGSKQRFCGGLVPSLGGDDKRRDCRSHVSSQATGHRGTVPSNGDSFSQFGAIVKPPRLITTNYESGLTIPHDEGKEDERERNRIGVTT